MDGMLATPLTCTLSSALKRRQRTTKRFQQIRDMPGIMEIMGCPDCTRIKINKKNKGN